MLMKLMQHELSFILTLLIVFEKDLGFVVLQTHSLLSGRVISSRSASFLLFLTSELTDRACPLRRQDKPPSSVLDLSAATTRKGTN